MKRASEFWVNPEILRWARERIGFTYSEVEEHSRKLGKYYEPVTAEQLKRWEQGLEEPDLTHLETLAEIYVCPVGYFFLPEPPEEQLPLSKRGLSSDKKLSPLSVQTLRRFYELAEWTVAIIEEHNIAWDVKIEKKQGIKLDELVAQERKRFGFNPDVRKNWVSKEDAFLWWRRRIEDLGIFCFEMKLDPKEIRGAALWLKKFPFMLVNHKDIEAATGRIFTLLHEYAHLLIDHNGVVCDFRGIRSGKNPEPFANRFAARMLLSYEELADRLEELGWFEFRENWSDKALDEIRKPFFVSRDVVLITLQEMGLAPEDLYEKKREQWDRRKPFGRGGKRPKQFESKLFQIGYSLASVLTNPHVSSSISHIELAEVLDLKVSKVRPFLEWANAQLAVR